MLQLIVDVARGLIITTLFIASVTFGLIGKLTPRPQGYVSLLEAAKILWPAYVATLRNMLTNIMFWGFMGAMTAFWIVASIWGWFPRQ